MDDFEERVRRGLRSDLGAVEPEAVLADVSRGVVRRRRRRTSLAVAATVLVIGGALGTVAVLADDGRERANPILPAPTPTQPALPPGATQGVIDASAADGVFRLTTNVGCAACSTVWRQDPTADGGWERLHDFGAEAYVGPVNAIYGPVTNLVMADAENGWAWGYRLFATHDGGKTWTPVTTGPGRVNGDFGHKVSVTDEYVWSLLRTDRGTELWRSTPYSDAWTRVRAPNMRGVSDMLTIGRHVALQTSDEGLAGPRLQYSPNGTTWGVVDDPCPGDHRILPASTVAYVLCDGARRTTVHLLIGPEHQELDLDRWEVFGSFDAEPGDTAVPVGELAVLVVDLESRARLITPEGTRTVDLGLERDETVFPASSGSVGLLVTSSNRLLRTTDDGLTWHQLE